MNNRRLKKELKAALASPRPVRRDEFLQTLPYPKATGLAFGLAQVGYIRGRFWLLSLLWLAGTAVFFQSLQLDREMVGVLAALLPLLSLVGMVELHKSASCGMAELEMSCKYNLERVLLARLVIIATAHLILLLAAVLLFRGHSQYGLLRYALYAVTPFLLSSYLSFWLTNRLKAREALPVCAGATLFVSLAALLASINLTFLYQERYTLLWCLALAVLAGLLSRELYHLSTERNEPWNFA